jgi:ABC-2 type transport system ATP-binding protein
MLRTEGIVKHYGDHLALDGVDLDVPQGKIFGLLGPNGAGKSTLIRIINQITVPDEGRVFLHGKEVTTEDVRKMGYLPEERGLYKKMKVGEQAIYLARLKGMPKAEAKERLKHWFERWDMMGWWNKKVEELSKGMAQKVQFVTTVLHEPELIILDEPFSGFDPINAELIRNEIVRLRDEGATIMLSTHNMGSVEEMCDHIALINNSKKVLEGAVKEVRKKYSENIFSVEFKGQLMGFTNSMWTAAELLDSHEEDGYTIARIRLQGKTSVNDILGAVLPKVEIHSIKEEVPSMSEVFIKVVNEGKQTAETPIQQ